MLTTPFLFQFPPLPFSLYCISISTTKKILRSSSAHANRLPSRANPSPSPLAQPSWDRRPLDRLPPLRNHRSLAHRIWSTPPAIKAPSLWRPLRSRTTPAPRTGRGPELPFLIFLAAPALHLLLPPRLAFGMKATLHLLLHPPLALGVEATEAALRLGLSATAGQSQARRRRQRLLLPPLASRLATSPPSSAHRPAILRTHLPLPSRLRCTVDGARPAGSAIQEPLLHQRRSHCFGSAYAP
jgi:hypothetical protein